MTDYWSTQTGRIQDVLTLPVEIDNAAVSEGRFLIFGTTAANKIVMRAAANLGAGYAYSLKYGAVGDVIPALFFGVIRVVRDGTTALTAGLMVMSSSTAGGVCTCTGAWSTYVAGGGSSYVAGMALQSTSADADYFLILMGKSL